MSDEKKVFKCPECGGKGEPTGNTWPLTSPMALMGGNLIIMGTFECEECGNKFRKKIKENALRRSRSQRRDEESRRRRRVAICF